MKVTIFNPSIGDKGLTKDSSAFDVPEFTIEAIRDELERRRWNVTQDGVYAALRDDFRETGYDTLLIFRLTPSRIGAELIQ